jgi:hypothetical protein
MEFGKAFVGGTSFAVVAPVVLSMLIDKATAARGDITA